MEVGLPLAVKQNNRTFNNLSCFLWKTYRQDIILKPRITSFLDKFSAPVAAASAEVYLYIHQLNDIEDDYDGDDDDDENIRKIE